MDSISTQKLHHINAAFSAFCQEAGIEAIASEDDYDRAIALVDSILDASRHLPEREASPLHRLLDWLTPAIADYESAHFEVPEAEPRDVLRFLMGQHGLNQSDLPEVGNQSVVSQLLSGQRRFNTRQIAALCARFGVSADVFISKAHAMAA